MARGKWEQTIRHVAAAARILAPDWPMTVRQVFYCLYGEGFIENSDRDYQRVSRILTTAREEGEIPFERIVDRSRPTYTPNVFDDCKDYLQVASNGYRKDYWRLQPIRLEIWSEKDTVMSTIEELTNELGIVVRVGRGYNSASAAHTIATDFRLISKPKVVLFLGDHDPSGWDIQRSIASRVKEYGGGPFEFKRVAILVGDIKRYHLPPKKIKEGDTRKHAFRARYGEDAPTVELDALPIKVLRNRLRKEIKNRMDKKLWQRAIDVEKVEQDSIRSLISRWPGIQQEMADGR